MALESITTLVEDLETALDYEETGSLSKAKTVVTIVNKLIVRRPQSSGRDGSSISYDVNQLRQLRDEARAYVSAKSRGGSVRFLGPSQGFRG